MVVSGSADCMLWLWNVKKGSLVGDPWKGHNDAVRYTGRQIAPPIKTGQGRVYAVRYSPQGDRIASAGENKVICVWSTDGELLIEINGHEGVVPALCWSKDGANIFSASYDNTIRKWRLLDGKELVVFWGHSFAVDSLYRLVTSLISPDGLHLVSAARDCSVRIWDLTTNQSVGEPLLHDDELFALAISPDGKYIASAGNDGKIYVWNLEAAMQRQSDHSADASDAKTDAKLKASICASLSCYISFLHQGRAAQPRHIHQTFQPNNRGLAKYGKDFWDADTNSTPHPAAPPANPLSTLHWRNFLGPLRVSIRPSNAPQPIPLEPRRWNFNFRGGSSIPTRIFVSPPSAAELARAEAAAAAQHANGNQAGSSTPVGQPQAVPGAQVSQGRPTETQGAGGGTGDVSYDGVSCCGFFFGRRRSTSHQP
ncbi:WD40 repeat-like protein [Suillus brevipes Sb2]|nr:WD40 repeat-like protein [Suillus brevipes Sb2]